MSVKRWLQGPVEQDTPGRHDLAHKIKIPDVSGKDAIATLQGMQIDGGIVKSGHLLAGLETAEPEHQSRQNASLQQNAGTDLALDAVWRKVRDDP